MKNIITKADYTNGPNDNLVKAFVDNRSPRQVIEDNFEKGLIDQDTYDKATNVLIKAKGEGSKGGKVIGHTKSGKAIYATKSAKSKSYKDFTDQDHKDAEVAHLVVNTARGPQSEYSSYHHADMADSHNKVWFENNRKQQKRASDLEQGRDVGHETRGM